MTHRWSVGLWIGLGVIMLILKKCMPDYHRIHREASERNAKYVKVHARVKLCAESIGFFGGGERENQMATRAFEGVRKCSRSLCVFLRSSKKAAAQQPHRILDQARCVGGLIR